MDPTECPFREFRDNELQPEFWGLGPSAYRAAILVSKTAGKLSVDHEWVDEQIQPLPRSARQYLRGWVRAEDLARRRWHADTVVFEDNGTKMSVADTQLSHAQVLLRSSFCRRVLSACYILERIDGFVVEHQWENFAFSSGPEGWRAKYHIYSPGMKSGGGPQHKPGLSKNGCYLIRLFYLGTWRCIWVSDQVPVDGNESPLLPFSPLLSHTAKLGLKQPSNITTPAVHLWPLLLCKALLKLAAPDMNSDEDIDCLEDEQFTEFNIMHCLTGSLNITYQIKDAEALWDFLHKEVPLFSWDDDDDTLTSTVKSRSNKKPTTKESAIRKSMTTLVIEDTKDHPPYSLPGIAPGHEMDLLVTMARDIPLKKPLPVPEIPLWKNYRWVDWARNHGLYDAYDYPRTKYLKVNGLLKMSYAPHMLDVQSTETITHAFRHEHDRTVPIKKTTKDLNRSNTPNQSTVIQQGKEELREWVLFNQLQQLTKRVNVHFYPSMHQITSATNIPPTRTKAINRALYDPASKSAPLYLQIDGPNENVLRISLNMLHPRILFNSGVPMDHIEEIESAYLILEKFEWFVDSEVPILKALVQTQGYDSVEVKFPPGRHFFRLWVHSRMNWHMMLLSESHLLLSSRDLIQCAAVHECSWVSHFLSNLSTSFSNWIRVDRSSSNILEVDREFYKSYQPDLTWDPQVVGYNKSFLHWMFRQALQSFLVKRLQNADFRSVCAVLRRYFNDPEFGLPPKPLPLKSVREIIKADPCDCFIFKSEETDIMKEQVVEKKHNIIIPRTLKTIKPMPSYVCELATEEAPCGILKTERKNVFKQHEAATILQARWRGMWARKCLKANVTVAPDILKTIMENTFGNLESLSAFLNEFFRMYPGAKYAYSVASALNGAYGLQQYNGSSPVTPKCVWIPFFQGVFFCHAPVKVHFDIQCSSSYYCVVAVYDNDTGIQMPQPYNAHMTLHFSPNVLGYTVMGHGTIKQPVGNNHDVEWQLTVLSSIDGVFHVCDNGIETCQQMPLPTASKYHIDEIFIPNRRNILGGIQIYVTTHEAVSFRAAATCPDLYLEAILCTANNGVMEEIAKCDGKGEIYWPYIRLEPAPAVAVQAKRHSLSQANLTAVNRDSALSSARSLKTVKLRKPSFTGKNKSQIKFKNVLPEPKQYTIRVIAKNGWPLTLAQWKKVDKIRNSLKMFTVDDSSKKQSKEKPSSGKDKEVDELKNAAINQPQAGDAYIELECSVAVNGGAHCRRDDERDLEFAAAIRAWDANEPGRNEKGATIRKDFRDEFVEASFSPPSENIHTMFQDMSEQEYTEEKLELTLGTTVENKETKYLMMPEQLQDKFIPLQFVPFCTKEKIEEESILVTPDMAEAAEKDRHALIEAASERMKELQCYNETFILGRQKRRCLLLDNLFVDSQWKSELAKALDERDKLIPKESLNRTQSATKNTQATRKKK